MQPTIRRLVRDAARHRPVGLALGAVNQPNWAARCYGGTDKTTHGYGSHVGEHQWASFRCLFPALSPGGWYVLEDLSTIYWPDFRGMIPADSTTGVGLLAALVSDCQVDDPIHVDHPDWGPQPDVLVLPDVAEVHVHPGIAFIRKAARP